MAQDSEFEKTQLLANERSLRSTAEHANRMKDEFFSTLSHELRTPLNAILGWAQLLRRGMDDPSEVSQGLETIERNARIQTQLIEDLLDMSRIISGKFASIFRRFADHVYRGCDSHHQASGRSQRNSHRSKCSIHWPGRFPATQPAAAGHLEFDFQCREIHA